MADRPPSDSGALQWAFDGPPMDLRCASIGRGERVDRTGDAGLTAIGEISVRLVFTAKHWRCGHFEAQTDAVACRLFIEDSMRINGATLAEVGLETAFPQSKSQFLGHSSLPWLSACDEASAMVKLVV